MNTFQVVPNCYRTTIPKFHFEILLFGFFVGPLKILTATLKWAKMLFDLTFLKAAPEAKCVP